MISTTPVQEGFFMKRSNKLLAFLLALTLVFSLSACGDNTSGSTGETETTAQSETSETSAAVCDSEDKAGIEEALNLVNIKPEWTYSDTADTWTMAIVTAVTNAELPDYQGVSVCVPGAYVKGVDTDGDGTADTLSSLINAGSN